MMGRHVVGPLAVVDVGGIAVRRQPGRVALQVAPHGRVGVLADDQRGAGVMDEDVAEALGDPRALDGCWTCRVISCVPRPRVSIVTCSLYIDDPTKGEDFSSRLTVPGIGHATPPRPWG